jgi:L-alanine-DL-glutamate epimerase-like enolase superfamily enzyme
MKITNVDCTVLLTPNYNADACDSAQDTIVVRVQTDEGIIGIGEVDSNPWVVKALIEAPGSHIMALGLTELLAGQDPTQPLAIWDRLYTFTAMTGRRGAKIRARQEGCFLRLFAAGIRKIGLSLFRGERSEVTGLTLGCLSWC